MAIEKLSLILGQNEKVFQALASESRRKILAYLSHTDMTAGEIAARFDMTKPSLSRHLSILENAGLVTSEKKGQFIHYSLVEKNLINTLNGYLQEICPVGRPLRKESKQKAAEKEREEYMLIADEDSP
jgi:DNA-binding transcriptional ArsR family regulator